MCPAYGVFREYQGVRVIVYSFSIRGGDGGDGETLGCTHLLNDYAARAFGNSNQGHATW
jgi:hypothetical protein